MELRSTETFDTLLATLSREEKERVVTALLGRIQQLRDLPPGAARSRWVHGIVDAAQASFKEQHPEVIRQVRCERGCAHCCHLWVGITRDEAELLAGRVREGTAHADEARLEIQRHWESPGDFVGKPVEQAACVFLGPGGACTVYEDRPSACRSRLVVSDPEFCRGLDDARHTTTVTNPNLEIIVAAALSLDAEDDPPPVYGRHLAGALHPLVG